MIKLKNELKEKEERVEKMSRNLENKVVNNSNNNNTKNTTKKINILKDGNKKIERRAIIMVALNSFSNFFLRLPEISFLTINSMYIFGMLKYGNEYKNKYGFFKFCFKTDICETLLSISDFFFILNLISNFLLFYFFNKKFQQKIKLVLKKFQN